MIYLPCIVSLYHHRRPHIEQFNIGQAHLTIQLSIDKDEPQRQLQLSVYHNEDTKHKTPTYFMRFQKSQFTKSDLFIGVDPLVSMSCLVITVNKLDRYLQRQLELQ